MSFALEYTTPVREHRKNDALRRRMAALREAGLNDSARKTRAYYAAHSAEIAQARRRAVVDRDCEEFGAVKKERMSLGIALLHCLALPGVCYTRQEIAAWAGSTEAAIYQIERRALDKLRRAFPDPLRMELLLQLVDESGPAHRREAA